MTSLGVGGGGSTELMTIGDIGRRGVQTCCDFTKSKKILLNFCAFLFNFIVCRQDSFDTLPEIANLKPIRVSVFGLIL